MVRVYEALELDEFKEFQLLAGRDGLTNEITNVTNLDLETISKDYSAFHKGDFILSSRPFTMNNEDLICNDFEILASKEISGIAIKSIFNNDIPERLREMADTAKIPVFVFHSTPTESIINATVELMKEKEERTLYTAILNGLLEKPNTEAEVFQAATELDKEMRTYCTVLYAVIKQNHGHHMLPAMMNLQTIPVTDKQSRYSLFQYKDGILLILSGTSPEDVSNREKLLVRLRQVHLDPAICHLGLGLPGLTYSQLDLCIEQAMISCEMAKLWDKSMVSYSELGAFSYLLPLLNSRSAMDNCLRQIENIKRYDAENSAEILETLIAHVRNRGNYNQTAEDLYQHPNTIRYRIHKAKSLMGDRPDFEQQAFICINLYLLKQEMRIMPD